MSLSRRRFVQTAFASAAALAATRLVRADAAGPEKVSDTFSGEAPDEVPDTTSGAAPTLLILGGTGFLGPHLVEAARARGIVVTLFNRGKTNPHLFPDVEKLHGDRDGKLDELKGRTWDAVIDTSGYVPRIVKMSAELLAPSVKHYLFVSTVSVYSDLSRPGADETAPLATAPDPTTEKVEEHYGALKALCEKAAEAAMPGRVANVRPGLIVGPGDPTDRFTYWPVRMLRGGEVLAPGDGSDPVQIIDVRDLAELCVKLAAARTTGIFNALGPGSELSTRAMLDACRSAAGTDAILAWVPTPFLEAEGVAPWQDLPAWLPGTGETAGFARMSNARAVAAGLGFRAISDTAAATLAWWKSLPEERRAKLRAGLSPEREAEVLAKWTASRQPVKG